MNLLSEMRSGELLAAFASRDAAPAAGSAAALTGALAAALVEMVATLTVEKADAGPERLRERYGPYRARGGEIASAATSLRAELQRAAQADAEAVETLVRQRKQAAAAGEMETREAIEVPLRTARAALQVVEYAKELRARGYQSAAGDADVATTLAQSAAEASLAIAAANLASIGLDAGWVRDAGLEHESLVGRLGLLGRDAEQ